MNIKTYVYLKLCSHAVTAPFVVNSYIFELRIVKNFFVSTN